MPLQMIRNDISRMSVDAIVNTANPKVRIGAGTDKAIYERAGKDKLLAAREKIGILQPGEVAYTEAFDLDAKYIFHAVSLVWQGGNNGEAEIVRSCYEKSLQLAKELSCQSIAFPLIATGSYGFPKEEALQIAVDSIREFLKNEEMLVYLVVFDDESFELSGKLFSEIDEYIDAHYVDECILAEYKEPYLIAGATCEMPMLRAKKLKRRNLDDVVAQLEENFQERLFRLIDERGLSDVEVYKKANLDRKLFSKIRCNPDYRPKKKTALALAIALELNLDDTKDLLARAELALSHGSKSDLIVEYFIQQRVYDIYTINAALFEYKQPTLGD